MLVSPGRHVWIWARTDRDAPTARDVQDTAAALMARFLGTTINGLSVALDNGARRYSLGAARPLDVRQLPGRPRAIEGATREKFEDQEEGPFAVKATRVFFVGVDFDWRGPNLELDEWPRRKVNFFGIPVDEPMELDWLLLDAYSLGEASRPDITPGDIIREQLPTTGQLGVGALVVAAVVAWFALRDK